MMRNKNGDCAPISWQSHKLERICDSSLEAEVVSLLEGLKEAVYLRELVEEIFGLKDCSIPVIGIVDNQGTRDAIHSTAPSEDRRLRRDFAKIKQMLNQKQVTGITWVPGKRQLADPMTKKEAPAWELMEVLQTGKRDMKVGLKDSKK